MTAQQQQEKAKGVVDIIFLIDVTGSMQPCIDTLKNNIKAFFDMMMEKDSNSSCPVKDWRAKAVGFRDARDDLASWFVDNPFVDDVDSLKAQLDAFKAEGGGDLPESLLDALYKLSTMGQTDKGAQSLDPYKWRYRSSAARVVVAFTDAPAHETLDIPEQKGGTVEDVINVIQSNRVILSLFAPPAPVYDELCSVDKSEWEPLMDDSGNAVKIDTLTSDKDKFMATLKALARSVSKSAETPSL